MKTSILTIISLLILTACSKHFLLKKENEFKESSIELDSSKEKFQKTFPIKTGAQIKLNNTECYNPIFNSSNYSKAYSGYYYQVYNGKIYFGYGNCSNLSSHGRYSFTSDFILEAKIWYKIDIEILSSRKATLKINNKPVKVKYSSGYAKELNYHSNSSNGSIGHFDGNNTFFNGVIKKMYVKK